MRRWHQGTFLSVIDSKQRLKNGSVCELEPTHWNIFFTKFRLKEAFDQHNSINFNWIAAGNRTISSFFGNRKSYSNTTIQKSFPIKWILTMLIKRHLPHFSGHYWQRGSGFGALAAGIGCVALLLARRFILPTAKRIGKELLKQSVPEILDVVGNKKFPRQAIKYTISKTVKKQTGGSRRNTSRRKKSIRSKPMKASDEGKKTISTHRAPKRSQSDFFCLKERWSLICYHQKQLTAHWTYLKSLHYW